jgi:hypothetical protein
MTIQSGAPPRYQPTKDLRLDPVFEKADGPTLARAATLDNRVGGAARFADESPGGAGRGGGRYIEATGHARAMGPVSAAAAAWGEGAGSWRDAPFILKETTHELVSGVFTGIGGGVS